MTSGSPEPASPKPGQEPSGAGLSTRIGLWIQHANGLVVLIAGVVALLLTLGVGGGAGAAVQASSGGASSSEVAELQSQLELLRAEADTLRGQLAAAQRGPATLPTSAPSAPPTAPVLPSGATVRHQGPAAVGLYSSIDLDAPASDPKWTGLSWEMQYEGDLLAARPGFTSMGAAQPTYETCLTSPGTRGSLERNALDPGSWFCITTNLDHVAAVQIVSVAAQEVRLNVIVWE